MSICNAKKNVNRIINPYTQDIRITNPNGRRKNVNRIINPYTQDIRIANPNGRRRKDERGAMVVCPFRDIISVEN